jgi:hypothetical protein
MNVALSTDDPAVINKTIAEVVPGVSLGETLRVTVQRDRDTNLYHLNLSVSEAEATRADARSGA